MLTAIGYSFMGAAFKFVNWNPLCIAAIRSAMTIPLLMWISGKYFVRLTRRNFIGAFFSFAASTLFVAANKFTSAANAIVLQYTNPLFVMLFCVLILREKMRRVDLLLLLFVSAGMLLIFVDGLSWGGMTGNLLALASGIMMAATTLYGHYSKADMNEYILLAHEVTVLCCIWAVVAYPPAWSVASISSVGFMAVFSVTIPHVLFRIGVKVLPPVQTSVLLMLDPILNPIWVALIVGEYPSHIAVLGAGFVIISVIVWCIQDGKNVRDQY